MDERKGLVIDPYCGSGTTLVAAKLLGHDFIGIEISKEYSVSAENRLLNSENERREAVRETVKHEVNKTFTDRKANGMYVGRNGLGIFKNREEQIKLKLFEQRQDTKGRQLVNLKIPKSLKQLRIRFERRVFRKIVKGGLLHATG